MVISKEAKSLAFTFFLSILGGGMGVLLVSKAGLIKAPEKTIPPPRTLNIKPEVLIGDPSAPHKPYVLVEFMDYQCPPCRASKPLVNSLVDQYKDKLQLSVRNLPLKMHSHAFDAAVAAVAAKEQNKFWPMHEALLDGKSLKADEVETIVHQVGLDERRFHASCSGSARKRVQEDLQLADSLHLDGTPSWLLCTPEGKVWQLASLSQVRELAR
jgi:protein-disulfide isomerase